MAEIGNERSVRIRVLEELGSKRGNILPFELVFDSRNNG